LPDPPPVEIQVEAYTSSGIQGLVQGAVRNALGRSSAIDPTRRFFELGMNSLQLMEITTQLRQALGRPVPLNLFFSYPTISALAAQLSAPEIVDDPSDSRERGTKRSLRVGPAPAANGGDSA